MCIRDRGIRVLYSPCSSYTLHTREGSSMEELYPQEAFFAGLLPAMGVPYAYAGSPELTGQIVAASGQEMCIRDSVGTFGDFGCFGFHAAKTMTT